MVAVFILSKMKRTIVFSGGCRGNYVSFGMKQ